MQANFQQPVFLTLCHMVASSLVPAALTVFRSAPHAALSRRQLAGIAALAAVFSSSVIMGNMALRWVHVSFFQVRDQCRCAAMVCKRHSLIISCHATP